MRRSHCAAPREGPKHTCAALSLLGVRQQPVTPCCSSLPSTACTHQHTHDQLASRVNSSKGKGHTDQQSSTDRSSGLCRCTGQGEFIHWSSGLHTVSYWSESMSWLPKKLHLAAKVKNRTGTRPWSLVNCTLKLGLSWAFCTTSLFLVAL